MANCINRNDKNFKILEKDFGTTLTELSVRDYSKNIKFLPEGEFYIPTKEEFLNSYKFSKKNISETLYYIFTLQKFFNYKKLLKK
jgi:hypothetical protein